MINPTCLICHIIFFSVNAQLKLNHLAYNIENVSLFHSIRLTTNGIYRLNDYVWHTHCRRDFQIISINSENLILHIIILTLISQWWRCPLSGKLFHFFFFFFTSRFHFSLSLYFIALITLWHFECMDKMCVSECIVCVYVWPLRLSENEAHKSNRLFCSKIRCVCVCVAAFISLELSLK